MSNNRALILNQLATIDNLPTLPVVMTKLSQALEDVNCCSDDIVNILNNDPAISAQILKTVNSPLFSRTNQPETNLKAAITRLGFREVKNIALSTSVYKMFDGIPCSLFDRREFWRHCLATSFAAIEIANNHYDKGRICTDELHLAGLVHDLGKIILDAYFPELFEQALQVCLKLKLPLFEAEELALGIDHAELGYTIAENWHLPGFAIETIRFHHSPEYAEENKTIAEIVHIANYITNTQELGAGGDIAAPVFKKEIWDDLGLTARDIQQVVQQVNTQAEALNTMF